MSLLEKGFLYSCKEVEKNLCDGEKEVMPE